MNVPSVLKMRFPLETSLTKENVIGSFSASVSFVATVLETTSSSSAAMKSSTAFGASLIGVMVIVTSA